MTDFEIRNTIAAAMKTQAVSQYRLSRLVGMSQGQLSEYLSGARELGLHRLRRIADVLGLEIIVAPKQSAAV